MTITESISRRKDLPTIVGDISYPLAKRAIIYGLLLSQREGLQAAWAVSDLKINLVNYISTLGFLDDGNDPTPKQETPTLNPEYQHILSNIQNWLNLAEANNMPAQDAIRLWMINKLPRNQQQWTQPK